MPNPFSPDERANPFAAPVIGGADVDFGLPGGSNPFDDDPLDGPPPKAEPACQDSGPPPSAPQPTMPVHETEPAPVASQPAPPAVAEEPPQPNAAVHLAGATPSEAPMVNPFGGGGGGPPDHPFGGSGGPPDNPFGDDSPMIAPSRLASAVEQPEQNGGSLVASRDASVAVATVATASPEPEPAQDPLSAESVEIAPPTFGSDVSRGCAALLESGRYSDLLFVTEDDLKDIGVKPLHIRKLQHALKKIQEAES